MKHKSNARNARLNLALGLLLPAVASAQLFQPSLPSGAPATHYPAGSEGIKAGTLPPPGFYFRDYNQFYTSDRLRTALPPGFKATVNVYAQVPRLIYITEFKPLGLDYGLDILVPFVYTDLKVPNPPAVGGTYHKQSFEMADICVEPLLLSKHFEKVDLSFGYAIWIPTGEMDLTRPDKPGKDYYTHMLTLGGTYYFDQDKTWAASVLNRYEVSSKQNQTQIRPGQSWTLEWGLSKSLSKTIDVGLVGYYQTQITRDRGPQLTSDFPKSSAIALGPEISAVCTKLKVIGSLRYNYEVMANERFQGHNVMLTLTKRF